MAGLSERNKTLGELLTELRARTSFATQGTAAQGNQAIMTSFLQESHEYVYGELEPPAQRKKTVIELVAGSFLYDWHNDEEDQDINPGRVLSVGILSGENLFEPLCQGISQHQRADTQREQPRFYDDLNSQLEIWPIPDRAYQLSIEYTAELNRFTQLNDRPSVPSQLVFLYALATAKAHYRQPDAQAAATAFQNMLNKEKTRQRENRRYFMKTSIEPLPQQVVRTADGYRLGV